VIEVHHSEVILRNAAIQRGDLEMQSKVLSALQRQRPLIAPIEENNQKQKKRKEREVVKKRKTERKRREERSRGWVLQ